MPTSGLAAGAGFDVSTQDFELVIQVLADGFELLGDPSLRVVLPVTSSDPYPRRTLRLRPTQNVSGWQTLSAVFLVRDAPIGVASRLTEITEHPTRRPEVDASPAVAWVLPEPRAVRRLDLDTIVSPGKPDHRFVSLWRSPLDGVPYVPPEATALRNGATFDRNGAVSQTDTKVGMPASAPFQRGIAAQTADGMPIRFVDVIKDSRVWRRNTESPEDFEARCRAAPYRFSAADVERFLRWMHDEMSAW